MPFKYFMFDLLCYYECNQGIVIQFNWIFLKIFKCYFHQGNEKKNNEKNYFFKKQQFSVKILARFWLREFSFLGVIVSSCIKIFCGDWSNEIIYHSSNQRRVPYCEKNSILENSILYWFCTWKCLFLLNSLFLKFLK